MRQILFILLILLLLSNTVFYSDTDDITVKTLTLFGMGM